MKQFDNVVNELRKWLLSFSVIQAIIPFVLYILFVSLGISFLYSLIANVFHKYISILSALASLAHLCFLLAFWLTLISTEVKWAPYALLVKAFIILFPFTYFSTGTILSAAMYIFFGYWLLRYSALRA